MKISAETSRLHVIFEQNGLKHSAVTQPGSAPRFRDQLTGRSSCGHERRNYFDVDPFFHWLVSWKTLRWRRDHWCHSDPYSPSCFQCLSKLIPICLIYAKGTILRCGRTYANDENRGLWIHTFRNGEMMIHHSSFIRINLR